jgi:protein kinase
MHKYRLLEEIGKGNYCAVYKAVRESDGRIVAVKKSLFPYSQLREKLNSEVATLKKLQDHPTVIRLLEVIRTDRDEFYMVFEYQPMSLIEHYKYAKNSFGIGLSEGQIKSFMFQLALALDSLHKAHIMHRDIKPENLMVEGNAVKLIDFGLAKKNDFGKNTEYVSTRWYRAP